MRIPTHLLTLGLILTIASAGCKPTPPAPKTPEQKRTSSHTLLRQWGKLDKTSKDTYDLGKELEALGVAVVPVLVDMMLGADEQERRVAYRYSREVDAYSFVKPDDRQRAVLVAQAKRLHEHLTRAALNEQKPTRLRRVLLYAIRLDNKYGDATQSAKTLAHFAPGAPKTSKPHHDLFRYGAACITEDVKTYGNWKPAFAFVKKYGEHSDAAIANAAISSLQGGARIADDPYGHPWCDEGLIHDTRTDLSEGAKEASREICVWLLKQSARSETRARATLALSHCTHDRERFLTPLVEDLEKLPLKDWTHKRYRYLLAVRDICPDRAWPGGAQMKAPGCARFVKHLAHVAGQADVPIRARKYALELLARVSLTRAQHEAIFKPLASNPKDPIVLDAQKAMKESRDSVGHCWDQPEQKTCDHNMKVIKKRLDESARALEKAGR